MPRGANKTSWSKQSAVMLVNIVKEVDLRICRKELHCGRDNEPTKWDVVAATLHEASPVDATKSSTNCQYKFWELNRLYKFWIKSKAKSGDQKSTPVLEALKVYYQLFPLALRRNKRRRQAVEERSISPVTEVGNEDVSGYTSIESSEHPVPKLSSSNDLVELFERRLSACRPFPGRQSAERIRMQNSFVEEFTDRFRDAMAKRRAINELEVSEQVDEYDDDKRHHGLRQLATRMSRLTAYQKYKETGVGEDWRCDATDRLERRQKRSLRNAAAQGGETPPNPELPDAIESVLIDEIFSYWVELDKNPPTEKECKLYFEKKYTGEVRY